MGPVLEDDSPSKMLLLVEIIQEFVTGIKTSIKERKETSEDKKELHAVEIGNLFEEFDRTMCKSPEFLQNLRSKISAALKESINIERFSSIEVHD
jgi:hypothetical protein